MDNKTERSKTEVKEFDPIAAFKPLAPTAWLDTAWFETLADLGSEITSFVAERIREDVKTQHKLLHCKSLTEVQHVQSEFIQKAFDQYHDETGKLIEMSTEMAEKMQIKDEKVP